MSTRISDQVLVLIILMSVGFLSYKLKIVTKEVPGLFSNFIMKVSMPCLIITSFRRPFSRELLWEAVIVMGIASAIYAFSLLLSLVYPYILGMRGPERGVHRYAIIISNVGFIGFPVVETIMGRHYIFHASIYNMISSFMAFSIAAWLMAKEGGKALVFSWRVFFNVPFVATVAGFLVFLFSISFPEPVEQSLRMVGAVTTPLAMAVIGITIAQANIRKMLARWQIYITSLVRLLLIPALTGLACYFAGIRGPLLMLVVIICGMPAGSTTSILATVYEVAEDEGSSLVVLTTILSLITIPLLVVVIQQFIG